MFVSFEATNYGPFSESVGITTECDTARKEQLEKKTFLSSNKRYNLVNYIYGYNGSGKSNFFKALISMQQILTLSPIIATNNQQILDSSQINYEVSGQRNYFKFKEEFKELPTKYSIVVKIDDVQYSYSFEVLNKKIVSETLYKKLKRKELLINRTSENYEDIVLHGELKSFESFKSTVKDNVLCLSMAMFLNNELAIRLYKEIESIVVINMASPNVTQGFEKELDEKELDQYNRFIKLADDTIKKINISLEQEEVNKKIQISNDFESRDFVIRNLKINVESVHNVFKENKEYREEILPFLQFESNGTVKLFGILPALFCVLKTGGTIFVDEIENGLHPNLTKLLIELFYNKEINLFNAQLICSTHDILLLKNDIRRDQVWFLHKNKYGESQISRLSKFPGIRTSNDIAKKYLNDAFGDIPKLT